jgi:hypothetical protein
VSSRIRASIACRSTFVSLIRPQHRSQPDCNPLTVGNASLILRIMGKRIGLLSIAAAIGALAVAVTSASAASTFDRSPIHVAGLTPDRWGQSITKAESALRGRFPGIASDYCVGAIMVGHESESSFINGMTRYWDKLVCAGTTTGGQVFALIFDSKGAQSWIVYRLHNVTIAALRG